MQKATYTKAGFNFLPVILDTVTGKREILHGQPLADRTTAKKYAYIEIYKRNTKDRARWGAAYIAQNQTLNTANQLTIV